ncbi:Aste57867_4376 [Aphanomyces stellatus]|uniref:Aste57867_4376 protein n=1 Tax=Aphanomyces stellatus TaxID=120398 RepID=A0A485KCJ7_9STRA|nr:hypothetical protein As57867_004364 [Aphanomyces stellatus]VFT81490.1 Aste57867_4376 [Aphanomyces stellatus]
MKSSFATILLAAVAASIHATGLETFLPKSLFTQIFPNALPIYQYDHMIAMSKMYPAFANTGNVDVDKREVAAFLGQVALESGYLQYVEEIQKGDYCQPSNDYPCAPGQQYFGRGPIQLSWNYNYKDFGKAAQRDLVTSPGLVASDPDLVWWSAFWFWNVDKWNGNIHDVVGQPGGFAYTTYIINGGLECGTNPPNRESEKARIANYIQYCTLLGVTPGDNLSCQTSQYPPTTPWPKTSAPPSTTKTPPATTPVVIPTTSAPTTPMPTWTPTTAPPKTTAPPPNDKCEGNKGVCYWPLTHQVVSYGEADCKLFPTSFVWCP